MRLLRVLLVLVAVVFGAGWVRAELAHRDDRARIRETEELAASLARAADAARDSLEARDREALTLRARLDSVRSEASSRVEAARATASAAEARAAAAGATLDATLDSLEASAPPELAPVVLGAREQLEEERDAHRSVAAALRDQVDGTAQMLAAADSTVSLLEEQLRARDELVDALEASLGMERELREFWEREARPGLFDDVRRSLRVAGVAAGVGLLVGMVIGG